MAQRFVPCKLLSLASVLLFLTQASAQTVAVATAQAQKPAVPGPGLPDAPGLCSLSGTVRDSDGMEVPGATVQLMTEGEVPVQTVETDDEGVYALPRVACGQYVLVVAMAGFQTSATGESMPDTGGASRLDAVLKPASTDQITVTATRKEIAAAQVHLQEQQRLVGILPNFYVSYQWHAEPLTVKQKYKLALRAVEDPATLGIAAISASFQYGAGSYSGFGTGGARYGYLLGANYGVAITGTVLGGAVLPALFRQDPRYFYRGTGTVRSRAWYAISRAFVTRGDNGKTQVNWSGMLGDLGAAGISNFFYAPEDRNGASITISNGAIAIGGDCVNALMQEFVLRHFTTKTRGRRGKATDTP